MASYAEGDVVTQLADLSQTVDQVQTDLSAVVRQMNESLQDFRESLSKVIESESRIEGQIGAARQLEGRLTHVQELLQSSSLYPTPPSQSEPGVELTRVNEALRRFSEAGTQEQILQVFLDQSLGYVQRAILFLNKEMQFVPWNHVGFSNENIPSITAEDPNDPIVRAASQKKILYREQTPALGLSWSEESGNLPHAFVCIPLVFNQSVPLVLYADSDQTISLDSLELLSNLAVLVLKNQFLASLVQKQEGTIAAPPEEAEQRLDLEVPAEPEPEAAAAPASEAEFSHEAAAAVSEQVAEAASLDFAPPSPEAQEAAPEIPATEPAPSPAESTEAAPSAPSGEALWAQPESFVAEPEEAAQREDAVVQEPEAAAPEPEAIGAEPEAVSEEPAVSSDQPEVLVREPVQTAFSAPEEAIEEPPAAEPEAALDPLQEAAPESTTEDTQPPSPPIEMPVYEPAPEQAEPFLPPEEEEKHHNEARRFARLLVSEIKLYNEEDVTSGRQNKDLYSRLQRDIDRSREMYEKRVNPAVSGRMDYFHEELVRILAKEEEELLGTDYPGPVIRVSRDA